MMYMTSEGRPVAFQDRCPHRLAPLSAGRRMGDLVQCGYHGLVFCPVGGLRQNPRPGTRPQAARPRPIRSC